MESLHKQVLPFLLRRMKEDVLQDLPPKIIQDYHCELSPLQVIHTHTHTHTQCMYMYKEFNCLTRVDSTTIPDIIHTHWSRVLMLCR